MQHITFGEMLFAPAKNWKLLLLWGTGRKDPVRHLFNIAFGQREAAIAHPAGCACFTVPLSDQWDTALCEMY